MCVGKENSIISGRFHGLLQMTHSWWTPIWGVWIGVGSGSTSSINESWIAPFHAPIMNFTSIEEKIILVPEWFLCSWYTSNMIGITLEALVYSLYRGQRFSTPKMCYFLNRGSNDLIKYEAPEKKRWRCFEGFCIPCFFIFHTKLTLHMAYKLFI